MARIRLNTPAWFLLIVVAAFAIRLVYLSQLAHNPFFEHPNLDEQIHHEWAARFAAGDEWSADRQTGEVLPYFRAPLYIWFVGTIYKFFGVDPGFLPRLIQSLLGALSCGLVFLLGARLFGRRAGVIAGFGAAIYWILVYFDNELLIVPLIVFLDLLLLLFLVLAHEKSAWPYWSAAGLFLGLSAIARPNILLFAPAVCVWILRVYRKQPKGWTKGVARCFAFGLALLLPILPITVRNFTVGDDLVLVASQGGVNFYIGNNPHSDGVTAVVPGTPNDWWGGYDATHAMAERALGRKAKPSEVSEYFFDEALRFWNEDRGAALGLLGEKTHKFLCRQEYANNKCIYTFTEEFTPIVGWLFVGFWLVAPLGFLGLLIGFGRGGARLFPLWGFLAAYSVSVIAFFITARFRVPVVPVLIVYGAFAIEWLAARIKLRQLRPLACALGALCVLFAVVLYVPEAGFGRVHKGSAKFYGSIGASFAQQGDLSRAHAYLDRAVKSARATLEKDGPREEKTLAAQIVLNSLLVDGSLLVKENRLPEALDSFTEALGFAPPNTQQKASLHARMATILERLDRRQDAARHRAEANRIGRALRQGNR